VLQQMHQHACPKAAGKNNNRVYKSHQRRQAPPATKPAHMPGHNTPHQGPVMPSLLGESSKEAKKLEEACMECSQPATDRINLHARWLV
jgi:hypothetical protein